MLNGPVGVRTRCHHHKEPVTEEAFNYITTTDRCLIINATSQPVSVLVTSILEQQSHECSSHINRGTKILPRLNIIGSFL